MRQMTNWLSGLTQTRAAGDPHVLITILAVKGSAPRCGGSKMVVTSNEVFDTIGGGQLEVLAIERSRKILEGILPAVQQIEHYPLAATAMQCCGGSVTLFFEPLLCDMPEVVIFGAGHVGQSISHLLENLPVRTKLIDSRQNWLEKSAAQQKVLLRDALLDGPGLASLVPRNSWVFVLTHDHAIDFTLMKYLTKRSDLAFLGMIGSKTKWKSFSARLKRDGATINELARVCCPIGDGDIQFKEPSAIAIDVVARLLRDITRKSCLSEDGTSEVVPSSSASPVHRQSECADEEIVEISKRHLKNEVPGLFL